MKFRHDCVRDVLLFLESEPYVITNAEGNIEFVGVWLPAVLAALPEYTPEDIYYTLSKLAEGGYISLSPHWVGNSLNACRVNYITYAGHEFLETIKPDTVWKETMRIAGKIGSAGLEMLKKIAESVSASLLNNLLLGGFHLGD